MEPSVEAGQETPGEESSENYPGWERATISDVARLAGVSTTTVSNFLNDKGHMREETRQRIEAAIDQLHFSPNALVRAIRDKRTHILGVFVFGIDNLDESTGSSLAVPLLSGFYRAADRLGYNILLYTGWLLDSKRASGLDFLNGNIDGLIWVFPTLHEPALGRIASAGLPVISVLSRQVPDPVGYICIDNFGAMRTLVGHLVAQGHRRIAFAGPLYVADFQERRDGYREALAGEGLPWSADWEATTSAEPS
ncbi:MAG: LacI family DNA-binding transcriptional regulator, partial [Armatimonadota bacterium]